jgi:hypothetical protein
MEIVDTFAFLVGTWRVMRAIEDHRAGTRGWFEGVAALTEVPSDRRGPLGARARYDEVGELHFGTHIGQARRSLQYTRMGDATVMLYFTDGRPFVDLDLAPGEWHSTHFCGDDRYDIATFVRTRSVVEERWRVTGPATGYAAITTLTRAD